MQFDLWNSRASTDFVLEERTVIAGSNTSEPECWAEKLSWKESLYLEYDGPWVERTLTHPSGINVVCCVQLMLLMYTVDLLWASP